MKKTIKNKVLVTLCFLVAGATVGGIATVNASVTATADTISLSSATMMEDGAGVRIVNSIGDSGMRFTMSVAKTDITALEAQGTVNYGMFIAPKSYIDAAGDLTVENLFNDGACYYWDDNVIEGLGTITGEDPRNPSLGNKLATMNGEIWCLTPEVLEETNDAKIYAGSIINFAASADDLLFEYVCRGYVSVTDAENKTTYQMVDYYEGQRDNNTRSMTYVAQRAIEAGYDNDQNFLQTTYVDTVSDVEAQYTVYYYKDQVLVSEDTQYLTANIGETVTADTKNWSGYVEDTSVVTKTSGQVYANNKLVLSRYYKSSGYTYTFNVEGNETNVTVSAGDTVEVPANPTKDGQFDFMYWSTSADGEAYTFGPATADVTLYAVFNEYFYVSYHWADGYGTSAGPATQKVYKGGYAEDVRIITGLQYNSQAYYWHVSDEENPNTAQISLYDFSTPVTANLRLFTYVGLRNSWVFPTEAEYDVDGNRWGIESGGKDISSIASLTQTAEGMRFTVIENQQEDVKQLTSPLINHQNYNAATMAKIKFTYKNFGTDTCARLFVYAYSNSDANKTPQLIVARNYKTLTANMQETDAWQECTLDLYLNDAYNDYKLMFIRIEFVETVAEASDYKGTDILIRSLGFSA